ncbi:DNA gyrase inhibitor SbmC [Enterobacillus tribolii]|uniref:DNA gyrase inhibitor n=1 Tax=Enterobacillus tribolii TaxID=1487935 RepID=A0A370QS51_9GAMM|nr:DNA gyrase inhibitor SbmC [Enterobacillus tribolii]MBW7983450.1 DNA gyrase inhibitor SbmC [Enterobacillus tribolii]RDK92055.1 DNA gyrase inhibitor [Enterobacillus tribolii]
MELKIETRAARTFAGIRKVGPLDKTVYEGFNELMAWVERHNVTCGEWIAVYYDNPHDVPPEKMRVDTVLTVADDFVLPPGSEGLRIDTLEGGLYAVARAHITDGDFGKPWAAFFNELLPGSGYVPSGGSYYEEYLNDGSESGIWDFDMCVPVKKI